MYDDSWKTNKFSWICTYDRDLDGLRNELLLNYELYRCDYFYKTNANIILMIA